MEPIFIEKYGENLRGLFNEKLMEIDKLIRDSFEELERIDTRFSPAIGASINGRDFVVEVRSWNYLKEGKEVCKLKTMLDKKKEYFCISAETI